MGTSKITARARKGRVTKKADRTPEARNPFLGINGVDTIENVRDGLELFSQLSLRDSGVAMDEQLEHGAFLLTQTMVLALDAAMEQLAGEKKVAPQVQP